MNKKTVEQLKKRLIKERADTEAQLETFAEKDKKLEGDWDTRFPRWNGQSGGAALEQAADEVEEYSRLLPLEHVLELRLKNISLALEKIKKGKYGLCEKCGKPIPPKRLEVFPEAPLCLKCK